MSTNIGKIKDWVLGGMYMVKSSLKPITKMGRKRGQVKVKY
jgi:hypothetical protein